MKVAVFGCLHGMLNEMFETVSDFEKRNNETVELILVCGDCQTIRHSDDLKCLAVPNRFKRIGDFHEYYSGKKRVPKLTIFVGGNHEASNYLMTLPYGGWVCDNFYYLGYAGVVNYKGLRIAGLSGIYKFHDCHRAHSETMPLDGQSLRSIYHTRSIDILRMKLLRKRVDVFLSHDWPAHVYNYGDVEQLLRYKPHFKSDIECSHGLGNPLTEPLIHHLKPRRWFAAHLHCRFYAKIKHEMQHGDEAVDPDNLTEFLSLSKIETGQRFVEFMDISPLDKPNVYSSDFSKDSQLDGVKTHSNGQNNDPNDDNLYYDAEWLTILRKMVTLENSDVSVTDPRFESNDFTVSDQDISHTIDLMNQTGGMMIEKNFKMTEPVIYDRDDGSPPSKDRNRLEYFPNPQTEELCSRLQFESLLHRKYEGEERPRELPRMNSNRGRNPRNNRGRYYDRAGASHHSGGSGLYYRSHLSTEKEGFHQKYSENPSKKIALDLDEEGCLPFYVDRKGDI